MKCLLCCTASGFYRVIRVFQRDAEIRNAFVSFIALQSRQGFGQCALPVSRFLPAVSGIRVERRDLW